MQNSAVGVGAHQITKARAKKAVLLAGCGYTQAQEDSAGVPVLD